MLLSERVVSTSIAMSLGVHGDKGQILSTEKKRKSYYQEPRRHKSPKFKEIPKYNGMSRQRAKPKSNDRNKAEISL